MGQECRSRHVLSNERRLVKSLAKLIASKYLSEEHYSVVDRLATSINPAGIRLALYEILRGIDRKEIPSGCTEVIESILADLDGPECLEDAMNAAKTIAVLALSYKQESKKEGKKEKESE